MLSIFLTAGFAFAQSQMDRRATVHAAFENFMPVLYFLSGSDPFLQQLTPEEKKQFELLGNYLVPHFVRLGPPSVPGQDRTSAHIDFKLKFSDRSEDFVLNPGEPERTAKVTTDVWFNLKMIGNPSTSFSLLDAFQILFHEFGHKLGPEKNQALIDQVAAKMRIYLNVFYKDQEIVPGLRASSLILPQILFKDFLVDMQPEPMLLVERRNQVVEIPVDAKRLAFSAQYYDDSNRDAQSYARVTLIPRFLVQSNGLMIEWSIERKNFLFATRRFSYLDLFVNQSKVKNLLAMPPLIDRNTLYYLIPFNQFTDSGGFPILKPKIFAGNKEVFQLAGNSKWPEKLKIKKQTSERIELEAIVEMPEALTEVALLATQENSVYHFPGEIEKLTGNFYRLHFSIPGSSSKANSLFITGIGFNGKIKWDLEDQLKLTLKNVATSAPRTLKGLEVWDGQRWIKATEMKTPEMNAEKARFRLTTEDTGYLLNHLQIDWLEIENIYFKGQYQGARHRLFQESIPASRLRQSRAHGILTVEIESRRAARPLPVETSSLGFSTKDSDFRAITTMTLVDNKLEVFTSTARLEPVAWKGAFVMTRPPAGGLSCSRVHSARP